MIVFQLNNVIQFSKKISLIAIGINDFSRNYLIDICSDKLLFAIHYLIHEFSSYFNWIYNDYNLVLVMFNFVLDKSYDTFDNIANIVISIRYIFHNLNDTDQYYLKEIQ